jgi:two-component system response regulator PilR (NtrC family)
MMMTTEEVNAGPVPAADVGPAAATPSARARLLVVEDDDISRGALVALFRRLGLDVDSARTLSEAQVKLAAAPPDFVILDLMLPDGNGIEILRHVRTAGLPVRVAVTTGVFDWHLLDDVRKLGPERLYQKPVDAAQLRDWLLGL